MTRSVVQLLMCLPQVWYIIGMVPVKTNTIQLVFATGSYPREFLCRTNCSACADYQPWVMYWIHQLRSPLEECTFRGETRSYFYTPSLMQYEEYLMWWWCPLYITSGVGGGEFTKTLRKVCTCQKLKFSFLLLEYCKIRECYAVANAFTIRNMHLQKTINKTSKSPHAFAICSIRIDLLKPENEKIDSL
jgi:hypothetical protein